MARSISQIKEQITTAFMADDAVRKLYDLKGTEQFSEVFPTVSVESVLLYVFAFGMWVIENLFDRHRAAMDDALAKLKPHTLQWYINKAKAFQIDDSLPTDEHGQVVSDVYAQIIPKKQIVRYAVAHENSGIIQLKLAKYRRADDPRPQALQSREIEAVRHYFMQIKDAGVPLSIISNAPDMMKLEMTVFYNPMVLHEDERGFERDLYDASDGKGLVRTAVEQVIENLPFNGTCRKSDLIAAVGRIEGVEVVDITRMRAAPARIASDPHGIYTDVTGFWVPESGYIRLEELIINLRPYYYGSRI